MAKTHLTLFMFIGVVLGLIFAGDYTFFMLPVLFIMMSFSLCNIKLSKLSGHEKKTVLMLLALAYIVQGGLIMLLAHFFIHTPAFKQGLFLVAVMPPAISIIPLAFLFKGNTKEALVGEVIGYLLALIIIPFFVYFLIGESVSIWQVFKILLILIVGPFIISRFLMKSKFILQKISSKVIKACFLVVYFILIGVNRDEIFSMSYEMVALLVIALITMFIVPSIIYFLARKHDERVNFILFSSFKNGGLAAGIAIPLVGSQAAVPITARFLVGFFFVAYLEWLVKRYK